MALNLVFHFGICGHRDYLFAIFPVVFDEYWFISSYIVLIFLTPFLNWMVKNLDKRKFLIYLGIILVAADIMPFIKNDGTPNAPMGTMFSVGAMLAPYLIAAYVHKYGMRIRTSIGLLIMLTGAGLEYLSLIVLRRSIMGLDIGSFTFGLFPLITAVGIFMLFLNLKPFYSVWINWLASGVLAAYLITEHPLYRMYFWHKLLNVGRFQNPTWLFILMGVVIATVTVLVCAVVDHVYQFGRGIVSKHLHRSRVNVREE